MKRFKVVLLLLFVSLALVNAKNYNVSFLSNNSLAKIEYAINRDGNDTVVDLSTIYQVSSEDKIYIAFNTGSEYIDITSVKLRSYDGNKSDTRVISLDSDADGKLFCVLGDLGILEQWSVEPILERKPFVLSLESFFAGEPVSGTWTLNRETLSSGGTVEISSVTDFAVSFTYDAENYYFVSSSPKKLAESNGKIIFNLQKAGGDSSPVLDYKINLNRYTAISLGDKAERFIKIVYKGEEYSKSDLSILKFRNGESFYVYTEKGYVVAADNGLEIVNNEFVNEQWKTEIKVPEENTTYKYVINIVEERIVTLPVMFAGFTSEELTSSNIIVNVDGKRLALKDELNLNIKEDESLSIIIPKGTESQKYSIKFVDSQGILDEYDNNDITEEFRRVFSYKEVESLKCIIITKETGYRVSGIQTQIDNVAKLGVDVVYYVNGRKLLDGDFLSYGDVVTIKLKSHLPEDILIRVKGKAFSDAVDVVISSETNRSDFELECSKKTGFWHNFFSSDTGYGSITYKRDGLELRGEVFIEAGQIISWEADPIDGYIAKDSGGYIGVTGEISIKTEDDEYLINVDFIKKNDAKDVTVILKQPLYGTVEYYYNGEKVKEAKDNDDIYGCLTVPLNKNGGEVSFKYKYNYVVKGFNYPKEGECGAWITAEVTFDEKSNIREFVPIECVEMDTNKPELEVTGNEGLKKNAGDLNIYYLGVDGPVYIYKNGKALKDWEKKITTQKALVLVVEQHSISKGKVLDFRYRFEYENGSETAWNLKRTDSLTHTTMPQITEHITKRDEPCRVTKIVVEIDLIDASRFKERAITNATIKIKTGDTTLNTNMFVSDKDDVTLVVEPNNGYYIEGQEASFTKQIKYKDLDKTLNSLKIKKYVQVTLANIHPQRGSCTYEKEGEKLRIGTYLFREGEKITVTLTNINGYKGGNLLGSLFSKDIKATVSVKSDMNYRALSLADFNIVANE